MVSLSPQVREGESALVGQDGSNLEQEVSTLLEQIEMMIKALFPHYGELAGVNVDAVVQAAPGCYLHWLEIIATWPDEILSAVVSDVQEARLLRDTRALNQFIQCAIRNNLEKEARS